MKRTVLALFYGLIASVAIFGGVAAGVSLAQSIDGDAGISMPEINIKGIEIPSLFKFSADSEEKNSEEKVRSVPKGTPDMDSQLPTMEKVSSGEVAEKKGDSRIEDATREVIVGSAKTAVSTSSKGAFYFWDRFMGAVTKLLSGEGGFLTKIFGSVE